MTEEQKREVVAWLKRWPVGSRGRQRMSGGWLRVTVEAHELRRGGWPALRLKDELGRTRWCLYGMRSALVGEEDSRG